MPDSTAALKAAIDLVHVPSRVRPMRSAPLPDGVPLLLQIAAGDMEATDRAAELTGRTEAAVRDAASFFIEQILLASDSDSYRRLGSRPDASSSELRRNMALLLKWLHPDMEHAGNGRADRSVFAGRVTLAWDDLKTAERRAAYDMRAVASAGPGRVKAAKRRKSTTKRTSSTKNGQGRAVARRKAIPQRFWHSLLALFGLSSH